MLRRVAAVFRPPIHAATLPKLCSYSTKTETLQEEVQRLAGYDQTSVSLNQYLDTGLGALLAGRHAPPPEAGLSKEESVLVQIGSFLRRELPVRLARRMLELESFGRIAHAPSVHRVREWYEKSFIEVRRSRPVKCRESEAEFYALLQKVYARHAPTLVTMARGVYELRESLKERTDGRGRDFEDMEEVHRFLDKFYTSRTGIRILIGQYLELHEEPKPGYVGMINRHTSAAEITEHAVEDARYLCERSHGDSPDVFLHGRTDLEFAYVPSHLYYCMFELLKNSLRAVVEFHNGSALPPVKVIIADGEDNEDVVIKISDQGGGISRSHMPRIWSYLFTTAKPAFNAGFAFSSTGDHGTDTPLAGLGYGLPISRSYARYFGGDLNIMSMEGYGTDAYLHLCRLGNKDEPLP